MVGFSLDKPDPLKEAKMLWLAIVIVIMKIAKRRKAKKIVLYLEIFNPEMSWYINRKCKLSHLKKGLKRKKRKSDTGNEGIDDDADAEENEEEEREEEEEEEGRDDKGDKTTTTKKKNSTNWRMIHMKKKKNRRRRIVDN